MKKKRHPKPKLGITPLTRHDDLPASVGLVKEVRAELRAEVRSSNKTLDGSIKKLDGKICALETKMDGKFAGLEAKMDGKFTELEAKMDGKFTELEAKMDGKFTELEGKMDGMLSVVHRIQVTVEEQRSENRIVLDGLKLLMDRQDRVEEIVSKRLT